MPQKFNWKEMHELQRSVARRQRNLELEMHDVDLLNLAKRLFDEKDLARRRISLAEAKQVKRRLAENIRRYIGRRELRDEQITIANEILGHCSKRTTAMNLLDIYRKTCVLKDPT